MIIRIPLDKIESNPYQTRTSIADVSDLVDSIKRFQYTRRETSGLLQIPPARIWDCHAGRSLDPTKLEPDEIRDLPKGLTIQLAAGHRRWAAFNLLCAGDLDFATFPVDLQELTNQDMADIAWSENADREDISPIEEALALQRDMAEFDWTQEQIGQHRGLSRSAVANKLRLLQLPDDAQAAIATGQLTERHGRVLLSAKAKSPTIYRQVSASLIAPPANDEHAAKAREMLATTREWDIHMMEAQSDDPPCAVCGGPLSHDGQVNVRFHRQNRPVFLCPSCYRAGSDWVPPSVADAEKTLDNAIRWESTSRTDAKFPFDEPVPGVENAYAEICTACPYYDDQRQVCLSKACFALKTKAFYDHQCDVVKQLLHRDHPERTVEWEIVDSYGHYELRKQDETDQALWSEQCPTCEKCLLRHYPHQCSYYIYPYENLPFTVVCRHSASHTACVRRWQAEHQDEAETAREAQAKIEHEHEQARANQILDRAVHALSAELLAGNPDAWRALATNIDALLDGRPSSNKPADLVGFYACAVARVVLNTARTIDMLDTRQITYNQVEGRLRQQFAAWGLTLPESADDIARKLERMTQFLMDCVGNLRKDLTVEQISGNLDNLLELNNQIIYLANNKLLSEADYDRLNEWIQRLEGPLSEAYVSRETEEAANVLE